MMELIHSGVPNIVCIQPLAVCPNHIVGKGVIKEIRRTHPEANIVAIDYDPGASEVNQLNRIKLMLSTAQKNLINKKNPKAVKNAGTHLRTGQFCLLRFPERSRAGSAGPSFLSVGELPVTTSSPRPESCGAPPRTVC